MKIGVFYLVYYAFLAGFFMLMLLAFFATLSSDSPTYDTETGLIGKNPGDKIEQGDDLTMNIQI